MCRRDPLARLRAVRHRARRPQRLGGRAPRRAPDAPVRGVVGDFAARLLSASRSRRRRIEGPRLFAFLGSTLGNLDEGAAPALLRVDRAPHDRRGPLPPRRRPREGPARPPRRLQRRARRDRGVQRERAARPRRASSTATSTRPRSSTARFTTRRASAWRCTSSRPRRRRCPARGRLQHRVGAGRAHPDRDQPQVHARQRRATLAEGELELLEWLHRRPDDAFALCVARAARPA